MDQIGKIIKEGKLINNVINVNVNSSNNDNNVVSQKVGKFALDRNSFKPNTEETQLAEKIAISFNDLQNYAFYLHVIKRLGISSTYAFWKAMQEEIEEKKGSRYEIRNPRKYFTWKFKKGYIDEKVTK